MFARIVVVGVSTTDIIVSAPRLPSAGETLFGKDYTLLAGGKGANQAVAAARLGAETWFVSRIGEDEFGSARLQDLAREGMHLDYVVRDGEAKSGINLVTVDPRGVNQAVAALGAGGALRPEDVRAAEPAFAASTILLIHRGLPRETFDAALDLARRHRLFVIYSPAPPERVSAADRLPEAHLVICNRKDLGILSGRQAGHLETTVPAARVLLEQGAGAVVCTLSEEGAVLVTREGDHYFETYPVTKVDVNGAGDAFAAALAWYLSHQRDLRGMAVDAVGAETGFFRKALPFANACSALSVARPGGQAAMPHLADVERFLAGQGRGPDPVIEGELATAGRERSEFLEEKSNRVRRTLLEMVTAAGSGHPGGALSASDIMSVLFFDEMNLNANRPEWPDRDRFVLSKGHSAPVLYACLIEKGILGREEIGTLRRLGSRLQGHPDMRKAPGVEMSTGSLGQGLSVANGIALGIKQDEKDMRVYVLLGDGEMQEGQVWEAAMSSVHFRLDNLCAIIDYNGLQIGGDIGKVKSTLEPLVAKWESFGWYVIEINGHSFPEILAAFRQARLVKGRPTVVIAHTIKGKGVSFMERSIEYHGKVPSFELLAKALEELEAD